MTARPEPVAAHRYTLRGKIGSRPAVDAATLEAKAMLCLGIYALFSVVGWCLIAVLVAVVWSQ